jgi:hypothetical protein
MAEQPIGVKIPEEIRYLKKYQSGYPDAGSASKPGKNDFRKQGLHLKEKKCAEEYSRAPDGHIMQALRTNARSGVGNWERIFDR